MATIAETFIDLGRRLSAILGAPPPSPGDTSGIFKFVQEAYHNTDEDRSRIQKLRDFFDGDQVRGTGVNSGQFYIPSWPDEEDEDKEVRADRMEQLAWNRVRDGVLTHADALYAWGRGKSVNRRLEWDSGDESGDRKWLEDYLNSRVWRINGYAQWMWDLWKTVGAESRAVVGFRWLDASRRRLRKFGPGASLTIMRERGVVWMDVLDNLQTIPLPHPDQPRELGAVIRWYVDPRARNPLGSVASPYPGHSDTVTELITDSIWLRWVGSAPVLHEWGAENRYGDVRTLFAWVKNPGDVADSEDALPMQVALLEDIYNGSEIKRSHAYPETLYVGYDPPTREIDGKKVLMRGPNVAHVAPDGGADIKKVGPPAKIGEIGISQGDIHQALDEAMGLSIVERAGDQLGQVRSAPGIGRMQSKSERRRRRKILAAEKAEQDLFVAVREMTLFHAFAPEDYEDMRGSRLVITFPDDAFTQEPYTEAQKDQIELQAGMVERADVVRKRYPELTEDEVAKKVAQIEKELEAANETRSPDPAAQERSLAQQGAQG